MSRYCRLVEFALLFIGVPLLINAFEMRWLMIIVLWAAAATIFVILKKSPKFDHGLEWNFAALRPQGLRITGLFLLSLPFLVALTYFINPALLFSMPRSHPQLWAVIMVLYPVLSVWPQELIFRSWI